jgi:UDP-N-acetylmuramoylalanine--D-glutamate ligase
MSIQDLALQGKHNLFNSMAAGVAARILDLRKEVVRESLEHFEHVEHRLEFVARVNGITFINDSKATNVNSSWYALESQDAPLIWIAGGVDKGNDYTELYPLIDKVKALICLGSDNEKLKKAFEGKIETIIEVNNANDAVQTAYDLGFEGDVVLLSPACASFDLFENYEDRGHQFKSAVRRL